jgi:hypothetical protein
MKLNFLFNLEFPHKSILSIEVDHFNVNDNFEIAQLSRKAWAILEYRSNSKYLDLSWIGKPRENGFGVDHRPWSQL